MFAIATKETVQSIRDKFQFLAVITLFFPVTLNAVFAAFQEEVKSDYQIMSWGAVVAVVVLNYLLIEYSKDKMPVVVARYTEIFLTLSIICYIPVFIVFAMFTKPVISYFYAILLGIGILGIMLIPFLVFMLLIGNAVIYYRRDEITWTCKTILRFFVKYCKFKRTDSRKC